MSSLSVPISRKRHLFPEFRDDSDPELPSKRIKHEDTFRTKLQQVTSWILEFRNVNVDRFVKMALRCGANLPPPRRTRVVEDDSEEDHDDDDNDDEEIDLVDIDDDDDDDIQEIKENVQQEKLYPLNKEFGKFSFSNDSGSSKQQVAVNGSYSPDSLFNSYRLNGGACARDLSTRYHGTTACNLRRAQTDQLKRKPLVSNPRTEIELLLGQEQPEVALEGDGIEILSESPSSKKKNTVSQKSFRSSAKSSSKSSTPAFNQSASTAVKKSGSSASKYFTANEVVRLQEKAQYKLLLEKYINDNPYHHIRKKPQSDEDNKNDTRALPTSHFRKQVLEQPISSFIEKYYTPCRLLPSKAESTEKKKEPPEITIDDDEEEEEDEVQVVNMKLPQYKAVFKSQLFTNDWLSELGKHVRAQTEERNKIVEEHERKLDKIRKERQLRRLRVDAPVAKPVEAEFPELTPEIEEAINNVLYGAPEDIICKSPSNAMLRRKDFETLTGLKWLNDNIINTFFELIVERSKKEGYPSVYAFNTYFYSKLKSIGFSGIRRWTRKVDIFSYDINFVPLHVSYHWCLAVIDHRSKKILYYDSMGNGEECCLDILHDYVCLEYKDKKGEILDPSIYSKEAVADIPQQMNGSDCGMFTCRYAEYVSRDAKITFDQLQMQYFRRRTVYEIVTSQLL